MLIEEPRNKWLVTAPSNSPENKFSTADGKPAAICMGPTLGNVRYGAHERQVLDFGVKNHEFLSSRGKLLPWIKEYSPYAHVSADDPPVSMYYDRNLEGNLHAHSPQFGFKLQKRCQQSGVKQS